MGDDVADEFASDAAVENVAVAIDAAEERSSLEAGGVDPSCDEAYRAEGEILAHRHEHFAALAGLIALEGPESVTIAPSDSITTLSTAATVAISERRHPSAKPRATISLIASTARPVAGGLGHFATSAGFSVCARSGWARCSFAARR